MTPQQALDLINRFTSNIQTTREGHSNIVAALQALESLIPVKKTVGVEVTHEGKIRVAPGIKVERVKEEKPLK